MHIIVFPGNLFVQQIAWLSTAPKQYKLVLRMQRSLAVDLYLTEMNCWTVGRY